MISTFFFLNIILDAILLHLDIKKGQLVDNERGTHHAGGPHIHRLSVGFPDHHLQECFETFQKFHELFGDGNDNSDVLFTAENTSL